MLRKFNFKTDHAIKARCLNIVLIDRKNQPRSFIDMAILRNIRIKDREAEKHQNTKILH